MRERNIKLIAKAVDHLNTGDFGSDEVELLLIRSRDGLDAGIVRDIADSVAHPERDRGIISTELKNFYGGMKIVIGAMDKNPINIDEELPPYIFNHIINQCSTHVPVSELKRFGNNRKSAVETVREIFRPDNPKMPTIYHASRRLTWQETELLKYTLSRIEIRPLLTTDQLIEQVQRALGRLLRSNIKLERNIRQRFVATVVALLHRSKYSFDNGVEGMLRAIVVNDKISLSGGTPMEGPKVLPPGMTKEDPKLLPMWALMETRLPYKEWVANGTLFPIEVSGFSSMELLSPDNDLYLASTAGSIIEVI